MFGKPKPKPLKVTQLPEGAPGGFVRHPCTAYRCENVTSFSALLDLVRQTSTAHPDHTVLATLDDYGQACYTSGHARDMLGLEDDGTDWPDDAEPPPATFTTLHANLTAKAKDIGLQSLARKLYWSHPDTPPFVQLQHEPDRVIDRQKTYLLLAPVAHASEAIAAFPNGYFSSDLSPMENLTLARHLERTYGYRLFGLGASYIGFLRNTPLSDDAARALATDIQLLHRDADPAEIPVMAAVLQTNDWLLLFYSGR